MKKILAILAAMMAVVAVVFAPVAVFADEGSETQKDCVDTAIIKNDGDQYCDTEGSGIYRILNIVVNILTIGVGVLGTLGIVISGAQYLTAGGNEAQMGKAKKRIGEVVLGLVVYGVMWVVLQWLIPGGIL